MVASFCTLYPWCWKENLCLRRFLCPPNSSGPFGTCFTARASGLPTAAAKSSVQSPGMNSRHRRPFFGNFLAYPPVCWLRRAFPRRSRGLSWRVSRRAEASGMMGSEILTNVAAWVACLAPRTWSPWPWKAIVHRYLLFEDTLEGRTMARSEKNAPSASTHSNPMRKF